MQKLKPSKDVRNPISFSLLKQLIDTVHLVFQDHYTITLFKSMYALAFFGILRIGEFTRSDKGQGHQLQLELR